MQETPRDNLRLHEKMRDVTWGDPNAMRSITFRSFTLAVDPNVAVLPFAEVEDAVFLRKEILLWQVGLDAHLTITEMPTIMEFPFFLAYKLSLDEMARVTPLWTGSPESGDWFKLRNMSDDRKSQWFLFRREPWSTIVSLEFSAEPVDALVVAASLNRVLWEHSQT